MPWEIGLREERVNLVESKRTFSRRNGPPSEKKRLTWQA
jgi:hypothetical protein